MWKYFEFMQFCSSLQMQPLSCVQDTDIQSDSITNQSLCFGYCLGNKNSLSHRWHMRRSPQSFPDICKLCHSPLLLSLYIPMSMKILKNASTNIFKEHTSHLHFHSQVCFTDSREMRNTMTKQLPHLPDGSSSLNIMRVVPPKFHVNISYSSV